MFFNKSCILSAVIALSFLSFQDWCFLGDWTTLLGSYDLVFGVCVVECATVPINQSSLFVTCNYIRYSHSEMWCVQLFLLVSQKQVLVVCKLVNVLTTNKMPAGLFFPIKFSSKVCFLHHKMAVLSTFKVNQSPSRVCILIIKFIWLELTQSTSINRPEVEIFQSFTLVKVATPQCRNTKILHLHIKALHLKSRLSKSTQVFSIKCKYKSTHYIEWPSSELYCYDNTIMLLLMH